MKMKGMKYIIFIGVILFCLNSCKEETVGQPSINSNQPDAISNPVVENIPGGAIITYDLPQENYLLGVKAVYVLNGEEKYTNASMYTNKVKIEGYGSTDIQTVKLYTVDRSLNESEPVSVNIQPLTPPISTIFESIVMDKSFGGVYLKWENKNEADIAIYVMAEDSIGDMKVAEVIYSSAKEGSYGIRGFDTEEREFATYVRDRWNNHSDTLVRRLTPIFEERLDRTLHKRQPLPGDNLTEFPGWPFNNMFNGIEAGDEGWLTDLNAGTTLPVTFTVDLGTTTKLSRYKLWHRDGSFLFQHCNPRLWTVYGSATLTKDPTVYLEYYQTDEYKQDWFYMGNFTPVRPSGTPDSSVPTADDKAYAKQGFEFELPIDAPPIRYLRFTVYEVYALTDVHISELAFWGGKLEEDELTNNFNK